MLQLLSMEPVYLCVLATGPTSLGGFLVDLPLEGSPWDVAQLSKALGTWNGCTWVFQVGGPLGSAMSWLCCNPVENPQCFV